jgi:peptidoglycan/xylan/chitin deacetylase (PgdA/CDA1 family)
MNGKKNSTRDVLVFFMFLLFIIHLCVRDAAVFHRVAASVFHRGAALFHIYSISGTVNGVVQSGVNITLTDIDGKGKATLTKTTDANGKFSFMNQANGTYWVTPSLTGYIFSPVGATITITGANVVGNANFTATTSIFGAVSGDVLPGVIITLSGTGSTTTTDWYGNYSFSGLVNGIYKVTPSLTYHKFIPTSTMVITGGANAAAINFTARIMAVTDVYIKKSSIMLLEMQTKQLRAIISPSAALNKNVIWASSNTSVASVSSTGLVTAVAVGNAEVTVTTSDGNMISTYSVEVVSPDRLIVIIKADDLTGSIGSSFIRLFNVCNLEEIPFSAGLIIETLETATASQLAFLSNLDPQEECELFIHGYTHYMKNGKTEFIGPDEKTQIATFKKILDTCHLYLKRDLSVFCAPGGHTDANTVLALDNFPSIKTVFDSPTEGNRLVIPFLLSAEYEVGKMSNHNNIIEMAKKVPTGTAAVIQLHPNVWTEKEWIEFDLLIKALKEKGAFFITPSEYAKWIERLHPPDLRTHKNVHNRE